MRRCQRDRPGRGILGDLAQRATDPQRLPAQELGQLRWVRRLRTGVHTPPRRSCCRWAARLLASLTPSCSHSSASTWAAPNRASANCIGYTFAPSRFASRRARPGACPGVRPQRHQRRRQLLGSRRLVSVSRRTHAMTGGRRARPPRRAPPSAPDLPGPNRRPLTMARPPAGVCRVRPPPTAHRQSHRRRAVLAGLAATLSRAKSPPRGTPTGRRPPIWRYRGGFHRQTERVAQPPRGGRPRLRPAVGLPTGTRGS
jgi:hypothetical protein